MDRNLKKIKKEMKRIEKKMKGLSFDIDLADNYLDRRISNNMIWVIVIIAISILVHICI
jgi:hypothetical protein